MKTLYSIFLVGFIVVACAPTKFVQPLKKGDKVFTASLGGPLIGVPGVATIPIPNTTLGFGYGINDKNTVHASLYPTSAIYGVFQFNGGIVHEFWKKNKFGFSSEASFDFLMDTYEKNARLYPQLSENIYFNYQQKTSENGASKRKFVYLGFNQWFVLTGTKAFGEKQNNRVLFNPYIGHEMTKNNWTFQLEIKFLAPYLRNDYVVPDYKSIFGNRGATGIYFGIKYKL